MAEEKIFIDVDINADAVANKMSALLQEMGELQLSKKRLIELSKTEKGLDQEQAKALADNEARMKAVKGELSALNGVYNTAIKGSTQYGDSLNELRRKLSDMTKAYDGLTKAQREGAEGSELRDSIKELSDELANLESATGRNQRNVGNYTESIKAAIPGVSDFDAKLRGLGTSFDELTTNTKKSAGNIVESIKSIGKAVLTPPFAVIAVTVGVIVAAFHKLREAFKKSDDAGTALAAGLATLKPIGTAIGAVFDKLANVLGSMVDGMGAAAIGIAKLANAVGIGDGEFVKAAESSRALVHSIDDLEETERQYTVNSAKRNKEVARLRDEAMKAGDPNERKKRLQQALDLEKANLEDEKKIAAQRLKNMEAEAKQNNDTSDATKDKIAQARAAMYQAEEQYYTGTRRLQREYLKAVDEINAEEEKRNEEAKKRREEYLKHRQEMADKEKSIAAKLQEALIDAVEDEGMREVLQLNLTYDREIEDYKNQLKNKKDLTKKAQDDLNALIVLAEEERVKALRELADKAAEESRDKQLSHDQKLWQLRLELAAENSAEELEAKQALLDIQMQQELDATTLTEEEKALILQKYNESKEKLIKEANERELRLQDEQNAAIKKKVTEAKEFQASQYMALAGAASSAFGAMSDLLAEWADESEGAAAASKAFALIQILTDEATVIADTAKAIAAAVAGATEAAAAGGPAAPFLLAGYIASMVGAVVSAVATTASSITQAKQLFTEAEGTSTDAGSYASGGVVGGTSYSGDRLTANVNSGEMILNRSQQTRLFDIANGQGGLVFDYSAMAAAMAAAVSAQPAPVMEYSEFKKFQGRTVIYNELARLR